jgi:hypothetical protein
MVATFARDAGCQSDRASVIWVGVIWHQIARTPDKGKAMFRELTAMATVSRNDGSTIFPDVRVE